jgi:predicted nucleotidyltransferase
MVTFALKKFIWLCYQNNPNVLETLFTDDRYTTFKSTVGATLLSCRHLFLSKEIYHRFCGYAYSQVKRLEVKKENMTGRKELAEKFGYDTKFAMHAVRLLRMGIEALSSGDLYVHRPDAEELLDIRYGRYTLEQIDAMVEKLKDRLELAYINSKLPTHPPRDKISALCTELHDAFWEIEARHVQSAVALSE